MDPEVQKYYNYICWPCTFMKRNTGDAKEKPDQILF